MGPHRHHRRHGGRRRPRHVRRERRGQPQARSNPNPNPKPNPSRNHSPNAYAHQVNASGLSVDASAASKPVQVVDLASGRIANEVKFDLPLGVGRAYVRVAGCFERAPPPAPGRRALVEFDSLELFTASQLV